MIRYKLFFAIWLAIITSGVNAGAATVPTGNLLHDNSFNSDSSPLKAWLPTPTLPWTPGDWNAEAANLIVGNVGAISAQSPDGMIRVNRAGSNLSQVSQIIDVSPYSAAIDSGNVYAKFSIWVNAPAIAAQTEAMLRDLLAPQSSSRETALRTDPSVGASFISSASDINTVNVWRKIVGILPTYSHTRYLHFEFYGYNSTIPTNGVFFDSASVTLNVSGDYNGDGTVDAGDYLVWRKQFGHSVEKYSGADTNGNGVVDLDDYALWRSNFGWSSPASGTSFATPVPEPSFCFVAIVVLVCIIGTRAIRHR